MAFHVLRKPLASGHTPGYLVVIYRIFIEFPGSRYRVFRATFASRVLFFGGGGEGWISANRLLPSANH